MTVHTGAETISRNTVYDSFQLFSIKTFAAFNDHKLSRDIQKRGNSLAALSDELKFVSALLSKRGRKFFTSTLISQKSAKS